jgi:hypothetical protein
MFMIPLLYDTTGLLEKDAKSMFTINSKVRSEVTENPELHV